MGRKARPINVVRMDGKKHLTKTEIEERIAAEAAFKPASDKVRCPAWLDKEGRKEWRRICAELKNLDLLTNVDVSSLACYCDLVSQYIAAARDIHERGMILRTSLSEKESGDESKPGPASSPQLSKAVRDLMFPGDEDGEEADRRGKAGMKLTITMEEPNPSVAQAAKCAQLIKAYLIEFGLSPSARVKLRPPATKGEGPVSEFAKRFGAV